MLKMRLYALAFNWILGWTDVACGLVSLVTLGLYRPWWDIEMRIFLDRIYVQKRIEQREKEKEL